MLEIQPINSCDSKTNEIKDSNYCSDNSDDSDVELPNIDGLTSDT